MELLDRTLLRRDLGLRLAQVDREFIRVEAREDLALFDRVSFLHQHLLDAIALAERERHLAQVDIAGEREFLGRGPLYRRLVLLISKEPQTGQ